MSKTFSDNIGEVEVEAHPDYFVVYGGQNEDSIEFTWDDLPGLRTLLDRLNSHRSGYSHDCLDCRGTGWDIGVTHKQRCSVCPGPREVVG